MPIDLLQLLTKGTENEFAVNAGKIRNPKSEIRKKAEVQSPKALREIFSPQIRGNHG